MINVDFLKSTNFIWNDPVEYNQDFVLYPVPIRAYINLIYALDALQIIKEDYAMTQDVMYNVKVIRMSNLELLISQMNEEDSIGQSTPLAEQRKEQFRLIFELCFHIEINEYEYAWDMDKQLFIVINSTIFLSSKDFDCLRSIVCHQHIPDFSDEYISKDVRDEIRKTNEVRSAKVSMPSLEDRITSYCVQVNKTRKDLSEVSVREFLMHELMYQSIESYKIHRQAELGGMVEFKTPIEHYLFKKKKSTTDGYLTNFDDFQSKVNQGSEAMVKK
jgi:hypothetical protein